MGSLQSNYLGKQPSLAAACGYTGGIAGEAGHIEEPPHTAAGQHRPIRSRFTEPRSAKHRTGFFVRHSWR